MSDVQISLPDELRTAAEQKVASGRYSSLSEYVSNLIRQDQGNDDSNAVETLLLHRMAAGPSTPMTHADFDAIRDRLEHRITTGPK
jgi:antitoxin ParD1/3/4